MTYTRGKALQDNGGDAADLVALGGRLREMRRVRDMTQAQIAEVLNCDHTAVSKIEAGKYSLSPQMFRAVERLLSFAAADGYETWFISYLEVEQRATVLKSWQPFVVDGLLQTKEYARAILRSARPFDSDAEVEQQVAGRVARQEIWERQQPQPPVLLAVMGEAALRRHVGTTEVVRAQLQHLLDVSGSNPRVTIQVLPFTSHAFWPDGPFVVASFDDSPDAAYLDNVLDGQVTDRRKQVARVSLLYDSLAKEALTPGDSIEMITRVMAEWT